MCGIVGIIRSQDHSSGETTAQRLLAGLQRLEYRGYDSAGIATIGEHEPLRRVRAAGKLENLAKSLSLSPLQGLTGIGHTRWATHGGATEMNAHPHMTERVAVVHNGIIENHRDLRAGLEAQGHQFETETDTEVIARALDQSVQDGHLPQQCFEQLLPRLDGAFAIAVVFAGHPDQLWIARRGTPLAVGYGADEMVIASDAYALAPWTSKVSFIEDGNWGCLTATEIKLWDSGNNAVKRSVRETRVKGDIIGKGGYRHFMQKEIFEQPTAVRDSLSSFMNTTTGEVTLPPAIEHAMHGTDSLVISACGTAYYAGLVGKYWLERYAHLRVNSDIASEFRYRHIPMPAQNGAALFVSQSGETLDTLEALRRCKQQNQTILSILNSLESTMERESDHVLRTLAGPEIGVASTKAFTTQLAVFAALTLALGQKKQTIEPPVAKVMSQALLSIEKLMNATLALEPEIEEVAKHIKDSAHALYLGRGTMFPMAMEGALKLKEISYIHAEGYAAGEMKHGPIALIDEDMPIIVCAPSDELFDKTAANIRETAARGGQVILLTDAKGAAELAEHAVHTLVLPDVPEAALPLIAPILYALPLQLLAYHVAVLKGTDVDQPRNLAKSVTVE